MLGACALFCGCSDDGGVPGADGESAASTGLPADPASATQATGSQASTTAPGEASSGPSGPSASASTGDSTGSDTSGSGDGTGEGSTGDEVDEEDCVFEPGASVELLSVGQTTEASPAVARDATGLWVAYAELIANDVAPFHDLRVGHVSCGVPSFDQPPSLFAHEDFLDHRVPALAVNGDSVLATFASGSDFGSQQSDYAVFDRETLEILGTASNDFRVSHSGRVDAVADADGFRIGASGLDPDTYENFARTQGMSPQGVLEATSIGVSSAGNDERFFYGVSVSAGGRWLAYTDRDQGLDTLEHVLHDAEEDLASPLAWRSEDSLQALQLRTHEGAEAFPVLVASFNVGDWPWDGTLSDVEVRVGLGEPLQLGLEGRGERGGRLALGPQGRVGVTYYVVPDDGGAAPLMFQELQREGDVLTPVGDEVEVGVMNGFTSPSITWTGEGYTVVWRQGSSLWMRTLATGIDR